MIFIIDDDEIMAEYIATGTGKPSSEIVVYRNALDAIAGIASFS